MENEMGTQPGGAGMAVVGIIYLAIIVLMVASLWKIFTKAGKPGWAAIIPIYNYIVLAEVGGKSILFGLLMLVPFVNVIVGFLLAIAVAEKFGKSAGFGIGLVFLPFIFGPMLAFGDAQYQGGGEAALAQA